MTICQLLLHLPRNFLIKVECRFPTYKTTVLGTGTASGTPSRFPTSKYAAVFGRFYQRSRYRRSKTPLPRKRELVECIYLWILDRIQSSREESKWLLESGLHLSCTQQLSRQLEVVSARNSPDPSCVLVDLTIQGACKDFRSFRIRFGNALNQTNMALHY